MVLSLEIKFELPTPPSSLPHKINNLMSSLCLTPSGDSKPAGPIPNLNYSMGRMRGILKKFQRYIAEIIYLQ